MRAAVATIVVTCPSRRKGRVTADDGWAFRGGFTDYVADVAQRFIAGKFPDHTRQDHLDIQAGLFRIGPDVGAAKMPGGNRSKRSRFEILEQRQRDPGPPGNALRDTPFCRRRALK